MKIALAHKRLDLRGGTERVFYRTAEGLRDRGHEIHLFCQQFRIPPPPGVWAHRVLGFTRPRSLRVLTFAMIAPKVIAKHNCDVVMSFDRILTQDTFRTGGGPRKILLEKMKKHRGLVRRLWYSIGLYNYLVVRIEKLQVRGNKGRKIIAVSEQTKREFMELYDDIPDEQIVVIHNGVDTVRFSPQRRLTEGKKLRERLKIPSAAPVVLFVGTGFRRKGLHRLLGLWERNEMPAVYLLVVGHDKRLSYYQGRWNGHKKVIFAGPQEKVEDYYACANVLVLPAIQEAFGNVILEAMASGLPVVTVAGIGAMDHVDGALRDGILSNPDDPAELKTKISQMLDRSRWSILSRKARETAKQCTCDNYLDRVEQTLRECLSNLQPERVMLNDSNQL
jgi:UDP-glucose:(heptosyl)LPS alpha-1,3-glucosyltransferase